MSYVSGAQLKQVAQKIKKDFTDGTTDNEPYLFRATPQYGEVIGRVQENYIEGGSIVRNQHIENGNFESTSGWAAEDGVTMSIADGKMTFTSSITNNGVRRTVKGSAGHIYLSAIKLSALQDCAIRIVYTGSLYYLLEMSAKTSIQTICGIKKYTGTVQSGGYYILPESDGVNVQIEVSTVQFIDLTQMFGSTIADHLATLPIADALELIKPWIDTNKYYEYNTGTIESVNLLKKKVTGFNQWDEEWEVGGFNVEGNPITAADRIRAKNYIPVIPGVVYYFKSREGAAMDLYFYDSNKANVGHIWSIQSTKNFTVPADAVYVKFASATNAYGTSYNYDICINISNPSRNGQYGPYSEHEYSMPSGELHGIPKLINNKIIYDGDKYYPDGYTERRYGIVDLGTLTWGIYDNNVFSANIYNAKRVVYTDTPNQINGKGYIGIGLVSHADKSIAVNSNGYVNDVVVIRDSSYTDAATFKASLSGVYLIYELATPTTSTSTPYQQTQIVDPWGTEEFIPVTNNSMPVGHNSSYTAKIFDDTSLIKLQSIDEISPTHVEELWDLEEE